MMQRRDLNASRNAGFVAADSDLALIIPAAPDASLAHEGMAISDSDGKPLVKLSGAKPIQIDLSDQSQCIALYESVVEFVKECYRDQKPPASRIGFALGHQAEQTEEKIEVA
jgi:hypothetical protein